MFCSIGPVKAFIPRLSKLTRRGIAKLARVRFQVAIAGGSPCPFAGELCGRVGDDGVI